MIGALHITRFTIQEAVSRRLILAGIVLSAIFLGLFTYGFNLLHADAASGEAGFRGREVVTLAMSSLLTLMGLYAVNFLASFLALFLSVGAVSGEIDGGTLHAVLARPIRRSQYIMGRWLAYVAIIAIYVAAMVGILLVIVARISGVVPPDPLRLIGLLVLSGVLLTTISLLGSTLMSTLANGVVSFTLFGFAWLAGAIEFVGGVLSNQGMVNVGIAVSLLIPSDALWRGASYYAQTNDFLAMVASRSPIPLASSVPPAGTFIAWALAYPLVLLALATWSFAHRDL
jgi:Cu-processing system permease protein